MITAIDHLVILVRDLAEAIAAYEHIGFTVHAGRRAPDGRDPQCPHTLRRRLLPGGSGVQNARPFARTPLVAASRNRWRAGGLRPRQQRPGRGRGGGRGAWAAIRQRGRQSPPPGWTDGRLADGLAARSRTGPAAVSDPGRNAPVSSGSRRARLATTAMASPASPVSTSRPTIWQPGRQRLRRSAWRGRAVAANDARSGLTVSSLRLASADVSLLNRAALPGRFPSGAADRPGILAAALAVPGEKAGRWLDPAKPWGRSCTSADTRASVRWCRRPAARWRVVPRSDDGPGRPTRGCATPQTATRPMCWRRSAVDPWLAWCRKTRRDSEDPAGLGPPYPPRAFSAAATAAPGANR